MIHACPACRTEVDARALAHEPICPVCGGWIDREAPASHFAEESPTRPSINPSWSSLKPPSDPPISVDVVTPTPRPASGPLPDAAAASEPRTGGSLRPLALEEPSFPVNSRATRRRMYGSAAVAVGLGLFCAWRLTDSPTTDYPNDGSALEGVAAALGELGDDEKQAARDAEEPPPATMRSAELLADRPSTEVPASVEIASLPPFDREAAERALASSYERELGCADYGLGGEAAIDVTFGQSGRVLRALAAPPFADTPAGECLEASLRPVAIPAFDGEPVTLVRHMELP